MIRLKFAPGGYDQTQVRPKKSDQRKILLMKIIHKN